MDRQSDLAVSEPHPPFLWSVVCKQARGGLTGSGLSAAPKTLYLSCCGLAGGRAAAAPFRAKLSSDTWRHPKETGIGGCGGMGPASSSSHHADASRTVILYLWVTTLWGSNVRYPVYQVITLGLIIVAKLRTWSSHEIVFDWRSPQHEGGAVSKGYNIGKVENHCLSPKSYLPFLWFAILHLIFDQRSFAQCSFGAISLPCSQREL